MNEERAAKVAFSFYIEKEGGLILRELVNNDYREK